MSADFLLELRSEEIPARMQAGARNALARLFAEELDKAGLESESIDVFSTPRRLALIARSIPLQTEPRREEMKGPRTSAPDKAIEGFLRKTGLKREQLEDRGGTYYAVIDTPGQATKELLGPVVERIVRDFPWPKSMRWGVASESNGSLRWVRPLHGIVAILGEEIVPVAIGGIESGATTLGHRFHHPGPITIGGAGDYLEKLRACHVIVDQEERETIIRQGAAKAAKAAGLRLVEDEGLVVENAGLTEWPVPLVGHFDADYLDVPREVIVLTMRSNQKYFACTVPPQDGEGDRPEDGGGGVGDGEPPPSAPGSSPGPATSPSRGGLAPAFVCVANIDAKDGGEAIVEGNRRVLAARLADARFFWEQDLKVPLDEQRKKLDGIVFHEKLGTVADKVERVAKLARWLVEEGIVKPLPLRGGEKARSASGVGASRSSISKRSPTPNPTPEGEGRNLADQAERAARLAKADLVTGMVGEFPELQGVIGGYLARAQGEPEAITDAVRDHYKPVGQSDEVPTAPVTVAVALADKLDTLVSFFVIAEFPSGSKDPFALRRAALGVLRLLLDNRLRISLFPILTFHAERVVSGIQISANTKLLIDIHRKATDAALEARHSIFSELLHRSLRSRYDIGSENQEHLRTTNSLLVHFFADRLKVQQREAGVRHDLIDAVFALGGEDDLVRLLARVKALQDFVETEDGADLLTAYKRAANILKKEKWESRRPGLEPGPASSSVGTKKKRTPDQVRGGELEKEEAALVKALDAAAPKASAAVEKEDFTAAMAALASLRKPIDDFFDHVTVNDPDKAKRARRLDLLMRFRDAVHRVADFSKIEG